MPRKKKNTSYHHGDLAQTLLLVSGKLIARKGVAAFSLREAARTIGVDPSACYRHYKDKNAILVAIARKGFTELSTMMRNGLEAEENASSERRFFLLAQSYLQFAQKNTFYFRVMFGPLHVDSRDPSLAGQYLEGEGPYDLLLKTMEVWIRDKNLKRDKNQLSLEIWSAIHGLTLLIVDGAIRDEFNQSAPTEFLNHFVKTLLKGFEHNNN